MHHDVAFNRGEKKKNEINELMVSHKKLMMHK